MARCPDCNKFVSFEMGEPEVDDPIVDGTSVTIEVRLTRCCVECGTELQEATITLEDELPSDELEAHQKLVTGVEDGEEMHEHDLEGVVEDYGATEEGKGKKVRYGVRVNWSVRCSCQDSAAPALFEGETSGEVDYWDDCY